MIPQLHGFDDGNSVEEKSSKTEGLKVEVHTEPIDDDSELEETMEKDLTFKCEYCEYTTREKQDLVKHAEKIHQCRGNYYSLAGVVATSTKLDFG